MSSPPCAETHIAPSTLKQLNLLCARPRPCWQQAPYTCTDVLVRCIARCMCYSTAVQHPRCTQAQVESSVGHILAQCGLGAKQTWFAFSPCKGQLTYLLECGDASVSRNTSGFLI